MMALTKENLLSDIIRTVKELILDEQKLVTYVSLSKELCIHINEAKVLLRKVLDEIKESDPSINLHITYIISGLTNNSSGLTTVCPESELETRRNDFKTVFFQHIYSACRGSSGTDNAAFVCLNKFDDILLCAGLIKGISCTKRSLDEIGSLKSNSQKPVEDVKPTLLVKKDKPNENSSKSNGVVKVHESKSEPVIKSEVKSPKKDSVSSVNGKSNNNNGAKPSKGIAGFFTKSNSVPSTKSSNNVNETIKKVEAKVEQNTEKESKLKIKQEEKMEVDVVTPINEVKKEHVSAKKTNSKKNSSLSVIKKNAKVDKKRKRVLHVSDSESDEDKDPFADEKNETSVNQESDDEIPPTPSVNTVKITSGILNPKKKRKIVDKTYTDEEGYILTRKEEVYESCSDEEMEVKTEPVQVKSEKENEQTNKIKIEISPKEKKAKNTKKKVSPPQKGKQANIMNFFKKI